MRASLKKAIRTVGLYVLIMGLAAQPLAPSIAMNTLQTQPPASGSNTGPLATSRVRMTAWDSLPPADTAKKTAPLTDTSNTASSALPPLNDPVYVSGNYQIGRSIEFFNTGIPNNHWSNITPPNSGQILDFILDPNHPYEQAWAVGTAGIWHVTNLNKLDYPDNQPPNWQNVVTLAQIDSQYTAHADSGCHIFQTRRIIADPTRSGRYLAIFSNTAGIGAPAYTTCPNFVALTNDNGQNWQYLQVLDSNQNRCSAGGPYPSCDFEGGAGFSNGLFYIGLSSRVWVSADAQTWMPLGGVGGYANSLYPSQLAGSTTSFRVAHNQVRSSGGCGILQFCDHTVDVLYRSDDGGNNWIEQTAVTGDMGAIAKALSGYIDRDGNEQVFLGVGNGMYQLNVPHKKRQPPTTPPNTTATPSPTPIPTTTPPPSAATWTSIPCGAPNYGEQVAIADPADSTYRISLRAGQVTGSTAYSHDGTSGPSIISLSTGAPCYQDKIGINLTETYTASSNGNYFPSQYEWLDRTGDWFTAGQFTNSPTDSIWTGGDLTNWGNVTVTSPRFIPPKDSSDATAGDDHCHHNTPCGNANVTQKTQAKASPKGGWTDPNNGHYGYTSDESVGNQPDPVGLPVVNLNSGNLVYSVTDLSVKGVSQTMEFHRVYSVKRVDWEDDVLGPGWTHNFNVRLILPSDQIDGEYGMLIFQEPDGSRQRFRINGDGTYSPETGLQATLATDTASGDYVLILPSQLVYRFDSQKGLLRVIYHISGNTLWNPLSLQYDGNNRLTRVIDGQPNATGTRYLGFNYDGSGHISEVFDNRRDTDSNSPSVKFTYDSNADPNLASATDLNGNTWQYQYDPALPAQHLLTAVTNPLSQPAWRQTYDDKGHVVAQFNGAGEQMLGLNYIDKQATQVKSWLAKNYQFNFDPQGHFVGLSGAKGTSSGFTYDSNLRPQTQTSANGTVSAMDWGADGANLSSLTQDTNGIASQTQYKYDPNTKALTQITDPNGNITTFEYNTPNFPTLISAAKNARGFYTHFRYYSSPGADGSNPVGYLSEVERQTDYGSVITHYDYNRFGDVVDVIENKISASGPDANATTTYQYDAIGRLIEIQYPVISSATGQPRRTELLYDNGNNIIETIANFVGSDPNNVQYDPATPANNVITHMTYDPVGRLQTVVDPLGHKTTLVYDNANRLIKITRNDTGGSFNAKSAENVSTTFAYYPSGQVKSVTDPLGRTDVMCSDEFNHPAGNIQNTVDAVPLSLNGLPSCTSTSSDPDSGIATQMIYDQMGNITDIYEDVGGNTGGRRTHFVYDQLNRQTSVTYNFKTGVHNPSDPADQDVISLTYYDKVGNVIGQVDPSGSAMWLCYDANNNLTRKVVNAATHNFGLSATDASSPCNPGYVASTAPDTDLITDTHYDALDRVTDVTVGVGTPTARTDHVAYDGMGRIIQTIANFKPGVTPSAPYYDANLSQLNSYDIGGRLIDRIDSVERKTHFVYDDLDRQIAVIRNYQPGVTPTSTVNVETDFKYDGVGNLIQEADPRNDSTGAAYQKITTYQYDGLYRLISVSTPLPSGTVQTVETSYDAMGNVLAVTQHSLNQTTTYTYDGLYRPKTTTSPMGNPTTQDYDRLGRVIGQTDANGIKTAFTHDMLDRTLSVIENYTGGPVNQSTGSNDTDVQTQYDYDVLGNLRVIHTARNNRTITYDYDFANRLIATHGLLGTNDIWLTAYNKLGQVVQSTDPNGNIKAMTYDGLGRPASIQYTPSTAASVNFAYDAAGRQINVSTNGMGSMSFGYDAVDRLISINDPFGKTINYGYDSGGRQTSVTLPGKQPVQYGYDTADRLISVTDWEHSTPTTLYQYDDANRLTGMTLPNNLSAKLTYDSDNQLTSLSYKQGGQIRAQYDYGVDGVGNRTNVYEQLQEPGNSLLTPPPGSVLPNQITFASRRGKNWQIYTANSDGTNLRPLTHDNADSMYPAWAPDGSWLAYMSFQNGNWDIFTRSADGQDVRNLTKTSSDETTPAWSPDSHHIAFTSTRDGHAQIYVMDLDANGNVTATRRVTQDNADDTAPTWSPDGTQIAYASSQNGNWQIYVANADGTGTPQALTTDTGTDYSPSWSPKASDGTSHIAYTSIQNNKADIYVLDINASGQPVQPSHKLTTGNIGNADMHPAWLRTGSADKLVFRSNRPEATPSDAQDNNYEIYVMNTDGSNLTPVTATKNSVDNDHPTWSYAPLPIGLTTRTIDYQYDKLYRLTSADYIDNTVPSHYAYSYDLVGNRTSASIQSTALNAITNYAYDDANRLTSDGNHTYTYDPAGNLIKKDNPTTPQYIYDSANRLTSYTDTQGKTSAYTYDGLGNRYQQSVNGKTTNYLLDLNAGLTQVLGESTQGQPDRTYLMGLNQIGQQDGNTSGTGWSYFNSDGLGSVRQTTDSTGTVNSAISYDPYGNTTRQFGSVTTSLGFTGQQTDSGGLVYLRARYYDPSSGTFLNRDPFGGITSRSMSRNGYSYAEGNPTTYSDPSGKFINILIGAIGGGITGAAFAAVAAGAHYWAAKSGACGCELKSWADRTDPDKYMEDAVKQGALMGAAFGALASLGPLAGLVAGAIGFGQGGLQLGQALQDISKNGLNPCNAMDLISGAMGMIGGASDISEAMTEIISTPTDPSITGTETTPQVDDGKTVDTGTDPTTPVDENPVDSPQQENQPQEGGTCSNSFSRDTLVATDQGEQTIGDLKVGDKVLAYNSATNQYEYDTIQATIQNFDPNVFNVTINDETLTTTQGHPFYTQELGWVKAGDLKAGEHILKADGTYGLVISTAIQPHPQFMYNLTIQNAHTFFVGQDQWLVHNCNETVAQRVAQFKAQMGRHADFGGTISVGDAVDELGNEHRIVAINSKTPLDRLSQYKFFIDKNSEIVAPVAQVMREDGTLRWRDAEENIVAFVKKMNWQLKDIGATRPICQEYCLPAIRDAGGNPVTPIRPLKP
jgi:RHS repeat-associated protein